jgi:leucyl aminopeptidase
MSKNKNIDHIFSYKPPFLARARKNHIPVMLLQADKFEAWLKKQPEYVQTQIKRSAFTAKAQSTMIVYDHDLNIAQIIAGISAPQEVYDIAYTVKHLSQNLSDNILKTNSFFLKCKKADLEIASLSWGIAAYSFDTYKTDAEPSVYPPLVLDKSVDKKRITAQIDAISIARNMINAPANDMGPAEIEKCTRKTATQFKAKIKIIKGNDLIKHNFPLIYTVGEAAAEDRRPRLIELNWGKAKDPKLTIVGKGVSFDTGGLNLKPTPYMALMKKDMGGAAHALATAYMVMALKLPVCLKLVIPAVENSISGPAFRPGDVIKSRTGITVENTNTDAEGRLILADSLAYACEDKPDLIIDFATLTGSARAALGHDMPAMFSTNDTYGQRLQTLSFEVQDPVWQMPLYAPYNKLIKSNVGDIVNSAGQPGDLIYSALFLKKFVEEGQGWVHLDCFAWESAGKPGRPKGGADTGLRAVCSFLERMYR